MSAVGDPEAGQWSSASDGGRWTKRQDGGAYAAPEMRAAPRPRAQPARKRTMVLPGQYPKGLEFKRKGGAVGPPKGKHAAHLVIMIGVMKHRPGAISEKAAKKRGLDAA